MQHQLHLGISLDAWKDMLASQREPSEAQLGAYRTSGLRRLQGKLESAATKGWFDHVRDECVHVDWFVDKESLTGHSSLLTGHSYCSPSNERGWSRYTGGMVYIGLYRCTTCKCRDGEYV